MRPRCGDGKVDANRNNVLHLKCSIEIREVKSSKHLSESRVRDKRCIHCDLVSFLPHVEISSYSTVTCPILLALSFA